MSGEHVKDYVLLFIYGPPVLALLNAIYVGVSLRTFPDEVPEISNSRHMERFKFLVAGQMYCTLMHIVFLLVPIVVTVSAFMMGVLATGEALIGCVPVILVSIFGGMMKPLERRVQTMPVSEEFQEEFDYVVHVWLYRPFPKW